MNSKEGYFKLRWAKNIFRMIGKNQIISITPIKTPKNSSTTK